MGVDILSTFFEVKEAYKRLALRFHPDKTKSQATGETFKQINEAYHILRDKEEREKYNQKFSSSKCSKERFIHDPPVYHDVPITLEDIYFGTLKRINVTIKKYGLDGQYRTERKEFILAIKRGKC